MPTSHDAYKILHPTENRPIHTKVVGVTYTNPNRTSRQRIIRQKANPGKLLTLTREPQNQYGSNAIAVYLDGEQIGYINSDLSAELAPQIDAGRPLYAVITEVTGGGDVNYGVNIILSWDEIRVTLQESKTAPKGCLSTLMLIIASIIVLLTFY